MTHSALAGPIMAIPGQSNVTPTGAFTYTIPIAVPPGTAGALPHLALNYSSQAGDGIVGLGWSLQGLPVITRCAQTISDGGTGGGVHGGVNYDSNDKFCLNGQKLTLMTGAYGLDASTYQSQIQTGGLVKVVEHNDAILSTSWFEVHLASGVIMQMGNTTDSRILTVSSTVHIPRAWAMNSITDLKTNYYNVAYINDTTNGQFYPTSIAYSMNHTAGVSGYNAVHFAYNTTRGDPITAYQAGYLIKTTVILTDIRTYSAGSTLVTHYQLGYRSGNSSLHSRVTSIKQCSDDAATQCLPTMNFGWQGGTGSYSYSTTPNSTTQGLAFYPADFNGDGLTDYLLQEFSCPSGGAAYLSSGSTFALGNLTASYTYYSTSNPPSPINYSGPLCFLQWAPHVGDFTGAGFSNVLLGEQSRAFDGSNWIPFNYSNVLANDGAGNLSQFTSSTANPAFYTYGDFNGDGRMDGLTGTAAQFSNGDGTFTPDSSRSFLLNSGYQTADFDGDGCSDVFAPNSAGTSAIITYYCRPATPTTSVSYSAASETILGDFNGDGKTDYLVATSSSTTVNLYLSTGRGFVHSSFVAGDKWGKYAIYTGDFDGDGRTDLALIAPGNAGYYGSNTSVSHKIFLSTGTGFTQVATIANTNSADSGSGTSPYVTAVVADWNSDGADDVWLQKPSGDTEILFSYTPELMTSVDNGLNPSGAAPTMAAVYKALNDTTAGVYTKGTSAVYPLSDLDGPYFVVSETDRNDEVGGLYATTYHYQGAKIDDTAPPVAGVRGNLLNRGLLTFYKQVITDQQTHIIQSSFFAGTFPYAGLPTSRVVGTGSVTLSTTTYCYTAVGCTIPTGGTPPYILQLYSTVTTRADLLGHALPTVTVTNNFDTYNNLLGSTVVTNYGGVDTRTVVTTHTYNNDVTNWILGQLKTTTINSVVGTSNLTRSYSFTPDPATGLTTSAITEPSNPSLKLEADYGYDAFGNRNAVTLSGYGLTTRTSSVNYDTNGTFPATSSNALSQGESWSFDPNFGGMASHTDLNALVTSQTYDAFGNPSLQTRPDGNHTLVAYHYCSGINGGTASCPSYGSTTTAYEVVTTPEKVAYPGPCTITCQNGAQTIVYYDAFSRAVATDMQGFDGSWIRQWTIYDSKGRVSKTSRPFFVTGGTAQWTTYVYDTVGRPTTLTYPVTLSGVASTGTTTYGYDALTTTVTNDLSQVTTTVRNSQGLVASVTDANNKTMTYGYDAFNDLTSTTDSQSNVTSYTYDVRGRKSTSADPDMGNWSYGYDGLDELTSQTDAMSQNTTLTYDVMGRIKTRVEPDLSSSWAYDTATNGVGLLKQACTAGTCGAGPRTVMSYDTLSRPSQAAIQATTSGFANYYTTYNADGRIDTVTYPSGFVAKYVYNSYGYLTQIQDNSTSTAVWTANAADAELHLTDETAANGIETNRTFSAQTGLPTQVIAGPAEAVANFGYNWDSIGNLSERTDTNNGVDETFTYNVLNEMTFSYNNGGSARAATYDALGNITRKYTACNTSNCMVYGGSGYGPHQLASLSGTFNGTTNPSFTYDADGNMTGGANRTLQWWSYNKLKHIAIGTSTLDYTYDSNHSRITQTSNTGDVTTYYNDPISGGGSEKLVSGGTTTWRDYIVASGHIVAQRTTNSGTSTWLYPAQDHLGSLTALTKTNASIKEQQSYDPWGKRRNLDSTDDAACSIPSASIRGFTGEEIMDGFCLVNLNGRIYDPVLGRFLSADTIVPSPMNGLAFNRYAYGYNNPLNSTDPTGHSGDLECPNPHSGCLSIPGLPNWTDPYCVVCNGGDLNSVALLGSGGFAGYAGGGGGFCTSQGCSGDRMSYLGSMNSGSYFFAQTGWFPGTGTDTNPEIVIMTQFYTPDTSWSNFGLGGSVCILNCGSTTVELRLRNVYFGRQHGFIVVTDNQTGSRWISQGGPSGPCACADPWGPIQSWTEPYGPGMTGYGDEAHQPVVQSFMTNESSDDVVNQLSNYNAEFNAQQTPYAVWGPNSNTYAAGAWQNLTGSIPTAPLGSGTWGWPGYSGW